MYSEWNGACYGIAALMGLCYENKISISSISDYDEENFYNIVAPMYNTLHNDAINFYFLSQCLENYGRPAYAIKSYYGDWEQEGNQGDNVYNHSDFYKLLINEIQQNGTVVLGYYYHYTVDEKTKIEGHSILALDVEQTDSNTYKVKLYDVNDTGTFHHLIITDTDGDGIYSCDYEGNSEFF